MSQRCLWPLVAFLLLVVIGCEPAKQVTIEDVNKELQLLEPRLQLDCLRKKSTADRIGDTCLLEGTDAVTLTWYSLVGGLAGTGTSEVPDLPLGPDTTLHNELLKSLYRGDVPDSPTQVLRSLDTAPVAVGAVLPPLVQTNQRFDVQVQALGGTKSLRGGVLRGTPLREPVRGRPGAILYGQEQAYAEGKVTLSRGRLAFGDITPVSATVGYIPGGATATAGHQLALRLRQADTYTAALVTLTVNERFANTATFLSPQILGVAVPLYYRSEWVRFAQVLLELRCHPPRGRLLRTRINTLVRDLQGDDPVLAQQAAYKLEALGAETVPALEGALRSRSLSVRLLAACTLAAMREPAGITPLMHIIETGSKEDSRLAARYLNFYTQHNVRDLQKELLAHDDPEIRYRALLGLEQPQEDTAYAPHREARGEDFRVTRVQTAGPPSLLVKARNPRRLIFFGQDDLLLRPPFKQEQLKEIAVEARDRTGVSIHYRVYRQPNTLPIRSLKVIELVRALDHINVTINDIMDLIFRLSRADAIDGEVLFLDE